jgi:hypothetical protein
LPNRAQAAGRFYLSDFRVEKCGRRRERRRAHRSDIPSCTKRPIFQNDRNKFAIDSGSIIPAVPITNKERANSNSENVRTRQEINAQFGGSVFGEMV